MNKAQKNFRKQIKELEKEGKIPDNYRARRKRPIFTRKVSIISIIFLLWNSFAIYTWVSPFLKNQINNNRIIDNKVLISSNNIGLNNNREIVQYLEICKNASIEIGNITNKIKDHNNEIIYTSEEIIKDLNELSKIKDDLNTDKKTFENLHINYNELISITEEIIININNQKQYMYERFNELSLNITNETIKLLEDNNIQYEILEDGKIKYYYTY